MTNKLQKSFDQEIELLNKKINDLKAKLYLVIDMAEFHKNYIFSDVFWQSLDYLKANIEEATSSMDASAWYTVRIATGELRSAILKAYELGYIEQKVSEDLIQTNLEIGILAYKVYSLINE
ncbi:MAG: hypothetical protein JXA60_05815 [Candidatus Coatesbacteria bacterium]|nr:hypothetical protein [Candidatus Coatesbacteria bacterium]